MDDTDRKILLALQQDCRLSIAELGGLVNLSASACHRRVKQLEESGVIERYGARLNRRLLGYHIEFFVEVELMGQSLEILDLFETAVARMDEILECHLMAGSTDYLLRVVAADVEDFERIHRDQLTKLPNVSNIRSNLAIRTVRAWSGYPLRKVLGQR